LAVALVAAGAGLAACGTGTRGTDTTTDPGPAAPTLPIPMATSSTTAAGTWAVIPMGRLDQPANTFWQLLYLPNGANRWSDQVEATATATNGGLLLAPAGRFLLVGIRPSIYLHFTPLITTSDSGVTWNNGLIDDPVEARPAALAVASPTQALALVGTHAGTHVLSSNHNLSAWETLVTRTQLASTAAGRDCGLGQLTAVAYQVSRPLVAGSCSHSGVAGLFTPDSGQWRLAPLALPAAQRHQRIEVLSLQRNTGRTVALLAAVGAHGTQLIAATSTPTAGWVLSQPLALTLREHVASVVPTAAGTTTVLLDSAGGARRLREVDPNGAWHTLSIPPAGTATIAAGGAGTLDALSAAGRTLTISSLPPGAARWTPRQVLHVALQYGSSS
jgi:hypothetical protein